MTLCKDCRAEGTRTPATRIFRDGPRCTHHASPAYVPRLMSRITVSVTVSDEEIAAYIGMAAQPAARVCSCGCGQPLEGMGHKDRLTGHKMRKFSRRIA